jgi:hypothetical protein
MYVNFPDYTRTRKRSAVTALKWRRLFFLFTRERDAGPGFVIANPKGEAIQDLRGSSGLLPATRIAMTKISF